MKRVTIAIALVMGGVSLVLPAALPLAQGMGQEAEKPGEIIGVLHDDRGKPLAGILLIAFAYQGMTEDGRVQTRALAKGGGWPMSTTDAKGRFRFKVVRTDQQYIIGGANAFGGSGFLPSPAGSEKKWLIVKVEPGKKMNLGTVSVNRE